MHSHHGTCQWECWEKENCKALSGSIWLSKQTIHKRAAVAQECCRCNHVRRLPCCAAFAHVFQSQGKLFNLNSLRRLSRPEAATSLHHDGDFSTPTW